VCGREPADLFAVGAFFEEFTQVSDAEVEALLRRPASSAE
jgi:predicted phosphoribosyltransferase